MNKNLFGLVLLGIPLWILGQNQSLPQAENKIEQTKKSFEQVKKEYNTPGAVVKDITVTDPADAAFFTDKTLENVTFNAVVTGDWKNVILQNVAFNQTVMGNWVNVSLKGTITFTNLPEGIVDEKTEKNKKTNEVALVTKVEKPILISKDGKTIKISKIGNEYRFTR